MSARSPDARDPLRWVPVDQLSELARSLLSEDLGGRDVVPGHVADRVTALAAQWMDHGFTPTTARPWADLTPACAAYLAGRGVDPAVLDKPINTAARKPITLRWALSSGQLAAEQAYDLLVATGTHRPPAQPQPAPDDTTPDSPGAPPRPAPAVFSHPTEDPGDTERHRRTRPSHTPFRP